MTYVFGGTLNLTQPTNLSTDRQRFSLLLFLFKYQLLLLHKHKTNKIRNIKSIL